MMKVSFPPYAALVLSAALFLCLLPAAVPLKAETRVLEEVLVTAQRRQENLQKVPVTVSVLSAERLADIFAAGDDIRALATRVPGLYAESSNGRLAPRFYIRGLGNTDFDLAASQPISVLFDEVVQENVVLKSFPLFDIERVEVLKGPQGSLFGRNTPGGIVKIETAKPEQEISAYASISRGNPETTIIEGAVGGGITDTLAVRISSLLQSREDWIDNGFNGETEFTGGYIEFAGRLQALWTPSERLSILGNYHWRDYDGTAPPFRANIIGPGNNDLNENFEEDVIYHDEGAGSPQEYVSQGASVRVSFDLGALSLTSITAAETTSGSSRGDVDGTAALPLSDPTVFPDCPRSRPECNYLHPPVYIPSHSKDGIDDLLQITEEINISSTTERFFWQAGLYLFDSDLEITTNPYFAPPTTVKHTNRSWAVFGQLSFDFTEALRLTAGLRYTDDEKDMRVLQANFPVDPVSVEGSDLSWDLALSFSPSDTLTYYSRLARGFRAPTIQGRDVAFFGPPSTADAETILALDGGIKATFLDGALRLNAALFYYQISDQQLTAIGGSGNFIQLINADKAGRGSGFEVDIEWLPFEQLLFTMGYSLNNTKLRSDLAVAPCRYGTADGFVHICTVRDQTTPDGFAFVKGNPFPHAPRDILYLTADYSLSANNSGEWFASADLAYQGKTEFFLYQSAEFHSNSNFELGARIGYRGADWEISVFARNLTNETNLKGGVDFSNISGYVNEPRFIGLNMSARLTN